MRQVSAAGPQAIDEIADRHGFSVEATRHMLDAVIAGNGGMAQFSHREFSGSGQWMRGGMTMVSDMFNDDLKRRVDSLCIDLARLSERAAPPVDDSAPVPQRTAPVSLLRSGDWWPGGLGHPNSAGSQNGMRYAYFARSRRLAIQTDGSVILYDTLDHQISGVSQQQSSSATLRFTSQTGPVDVASLPVVAG